MKPQTKHSGPGGSRVLFEYGFWFPLPRNLFYLVLVGEVPGTGVPCEKSTKGVVP